MEQFSVNQAIGDYRIVAFIGAGGMGEVYQGVHVKLGRPAAIKVLSKVSPDSTLRTRFFNEARVQSSIHHPNIATLYDFQEIGGRLFIFMELVDGESLEDLIRRRAFAVEDALKTFQSVVEAVAFIHRRGIVHRDIKSQNIKLTSAGAVKLLDFGIAKDAASQNLTKVGGVIGTPRYLAPEQFDGRPASCQTDVWALGVLFYEMLTSIEPFQADSIAGLCLKIAANQFEKPEKLNPAVPRRVSQIVTRCLRVSETERYATADELLRDVRHALGDGIESFNGAKSNGAESGANLSDELSSQPPRRKSLFAAVAAGAVAAVLLLFSFVGIGIWAMGGSNSGNYQANNSVSANKSPAPKEKNSSAPRTAGANAKLVHIDSFGGSAQVFRNGQQIGVTPFDLEAQDGEKIELILKRIGYEDKQVEFEASPGQRVYTFVLKPKY